MGIDMKHIVWHDHHISKEDRAEQKKQKPCLIWFTGLSGSGKSTVANALEQQLYIDSHHTYLLDGDNIRHGLSKDLGFSDEDRVENIRRIGEASKLFVDAGLIVMTAFISPFKSDRNIARSLVEESEFIEIYMNTPLEVCEQRDPKGLYKKARAGVIPHFTGIDSDYEAPENPELTLNTAVHSTDECVVKIIDFLTRHHYIF